MKNKVVLTVGATRIDELLDALMYLQSKRMPGLVINVKDYNPRGSKWTEEDRAKLDL